MCFSHPRRRRRRPARPALLLLCCLTYHGLGATAAHALQERTETEEKDRPQKPEQKPPTPAAEAPAKPSPEPKGRREPPALLVETVVDSEVVPLNVELALERPAAADAPQLRVGQETFALNDVLFLRFPPAEISVDGLKLILLGGDEILGKIVKGGEDELHIETPAQAGEAVKVSFDRLQAIVTASTRARAGRNSGLPRDFLKGRVLTDELYLKTGGKVEGILESMETGGVRFSSESLGPKALLFGFDKISAIRFADLEGEQPAKDSPSGLTVVVRLHDGSQLAGELRELGRPTLVLRHTFLGELRMKTSHVSEIAVRGGRCEFLSDLQPARTKEHLGPLLSPLARELLAYKKDVNVLGNPMRMEGRTFSKGLGVHAYSLLEYDLQGAYHRFQATVGLDASARPPPGAEGRAGGAVLFRIYLDGKKLAEEALSYRDSTRRLDLKVAGGKILSLEVDFGKNDFQIDLDRANWADARVVK